MTTETPEVRRKRLRFRSWHRGTREMDLLLGGFADHHIGSFGVEQLDRYEALLAEPDVELYDWYLGRLAVPPEHDHDVFAVLKTFRVPNPSLD